MMYAKSQMILVSDMDETQMFGERPIIEKTVLDDLTLENLELGDNFNFVIDPTRTDVTIKGDSAFISKLKIVAQDEFRILTGGVGYNYKWPANILVTVGVKNLKTMNLDVSGNAKVSATEAMSYDMFDLHVQGNASCSMDLNVQQFNALLNGNSKLFVSGSTSNLNADVNGNSKLDFEKSMLNSVDIYVNGNGKFYGDIVEDIKGEANGNGKIKVNQVINKNNVNTSGNGRFTIRN